MSYITKYFSEPFSIFAEITLFLLKISLLRPCTSIVYSPTENLAYYWARPFTYNVDFFRPSINRWTQHGLRPNKSSILFKCMMHQEHTFRTIINSLLLLCRSSITLCSTKTRWLFLYSN